MNQNAWYFRQNEEEKTKICQEVKHNPTNSKPKRTKPMFSKHIIII